MNKLTISIVYCCILQFGVVNAQDASQDSNDTAIDKLKGHYSASEIQQMKSASPEKYTSLDYYYNRSFIIEGSLREGAIFLDPYTDFDVSKVEHLRHTTERISFPYRKSGYTITLLSIEELEYRLPIHEFKLDNR